MFFDKFSQLLELITVDPKSLTICGEFNFHVEDTSNSDACNFIDILESVSKVIQHVSHHTV